MMDGYCRLCGKEKENLSNIFHNDGVETVKTVVKIQKVLSIDVRKDDGLPIAMCNTCENELERAAEFIEHTHQAQKHLKQLLDILISTKSDNDPLPCISQNLINNLSSNKPKLSEIDSLSADYKNPLLLENNISEDYKIFVPVLMALESDDSEIQPVLDTMNSSVSHANEIAKIKSRFNSIVKYNLLNRENVDESFKSISKPVSDELNAKEDIYGTNLKYSDRSNYSGNFTIDHYFDDVESTARRKSEANIANSIINQSVLSDFDASEPFNNFPKDYICKPPIKKEFNLYHCDLCEVRVPFDRYDDFQKHIATHAKNRSTFECKFCDNVFLKRKDLEAHVKTVHKENIKCPLCDFVCNRKGALTLHKSNIHKKLVACSKCDFRTDTKRQLTLHIRNKHTVVNPDFVCEICGSTFKTYVSLTTHRSYKHFPVPKQCPRCGVISPHTIAYSRHKLNCVDHRRYYCDSCNSSFFTKYRLKEHMNKHLNIRPYECTICAKTFFQRHRLEIHMSVHRGPRFQCDICGRGFNRKDNMRSHRKTQHPSQVAQLEANK